MKRSSTPIIVGAALFTQKKSTLNPLDPLNLMFKTSQEAISSTESKELKEFIDTIYIINIHSWSYRDAPDELSKLLNINPLYRFYLPIGGQTPQMAVNRAARAISLEESKAVLIAGGEAEYSLNNMRNNNLSLNWTKRRRPRKIDGDKTLDASSFEHKYDLLIPYKIYPLIETALRAASGKKIKAFTYDMGKRLEHFSKVASKNPFSWNQKFNTAKEIITPTPINRYISYPYTKLMLSNINVDQSAALIMTSEKVAEDLGINQDLWVYPMGGADFNNIRYISQRPKLYDSPAIREAAKLALKQSGLLLEQINLFDLYSCFPCMIEIAQKEIGISKDDPRDLTITGGLPFFGGPFSSYTLLSIVTAVDMIRKKNKLKIMITSNGAYNTKHSIGIYGNCPPKEPWDQRDDTAIQLSIYNKALPEPTEIANGQFTVEGYTFIYDKTGQPTEGIMIGYIQDGSRTLAMINAGPEQFNQLQHHDIVGNIYEIYHDFKSGLNKVNLNHS
ncbi:MAG: hypothetical protein ACTSR8_14245 [Promethearchaeota archaeon]